MKTTQVTILVSTMLAVGLLGGLWLSNAGENSAAQTLERYPVDLSLVGQHRHDLKMVPEDKAPELELEIKRDTMMAGHFNLHIQTENFTFAPGKVSSDHVLGEGHAHVFVDDVKISRAYGPWYHLPRLDPGEHTITVTLNTNDHQEYATEESFIRVSKTVTVTADGGQMQVGTTTKQ